jgi:hypothetical protein
MKKIFYSAFIFAALLTSCGGGEEATENEESTTTEAHADDAHADETPEAPAEEISTVGNWSAADKKKADEAVAAIDDQLAAFGDKKQDFIDCYLTKVENSYPSFAAADTDLEGCSALAESCATEVMGL